MANLQLLVMLEVVQDWRSTDAADLVDAAAQIEVACSALAPVLREARQADTLVHVRKQLQLAQGRLDGLGRRALQQQSEPAVIGALMEGLRRLGKANAAAQALLQGPPGQGRD